MLPGRSITSIPLVTVLCIVAIFAFVRIIFGQNISTQSGSLENLAKWIGFVVGLAAILVIAASAIYNVTRKQALTEYKELAELRKGKIIELELENAKKDAKIISLEGENESLEKKNLRLQDKQNE